MEKNEISSLQLEEQQLKGEDDRTRRTQDRKSNLKSQVKEKMNKCLEGLKRIQKPIDEPKDDKEIFSSFAHILALSLY